MAKAEIVIDTSLWVDEYSDMLYNFAVTRINDHEMAKDLVQDTFVSAIKGLDSFQGKSTVKTWLFSILKRKIIDQWRKNDSRKTRPMSALGTDTEEGEAKILERQNKGAVSEIEVDFENKELRATIMECIHDLPDKWKGIVIDKLVEEHDSDEVCKEHEITASNLWVIIHRAKVQLRSCLEQKWFNA